MKITIDNANAEAAAAIRQIGVAPSFTGTGVVICGGGIKYLTNAWVCINMLRHLGCKLPIQLWHRNESETDMHFADLVEPMGVESVCASAFCARPRKTALSGWQLKPFVLIHSPFKEVILLDADNIPVVNPEFLFHTKEFRCTGAIFWPDYGIFDSRNYIWSIFGIEPISVQQFESGQIVIDKNKCWQPLCLSMWYNENADFFYEHVHGDKDTFQMGFRRLRRPFALVPYPVHSLEGTMCQHDFEGRRIFQHRNMAKWTLFGRNCAILNFLWHKECLEFLEQLRRKWVVSLKVPRFRVATKDAVEIVAANILMNAIYSYTMEDYGSKLLTFQPNGLIDWGLGGGEIFWDIRQRNEYFELTISSEDDVTTTAISSDGMCWIGSGQWRNCKRSRLIMTPVLT